MPWTIDDLDTPAVLIDLDRVEANLHAGAGLCRRARAAAAPAHQDPQDPGAGPAAGELGAVGITCQKLGEAEVMADAGIDDILLTFNLAGPRQAAAAGGPGPAASRLSVTLDNAVVARGHRRGHARGRARAAGADRVRHRRRALRRADAGRGGRAGAPACRPAGPAASTGLMTYPARGQTPVTAAWLAEAVAGLGRGRARARRWSAPAARRTCSGRTRSAVPPSTGRAPTSIATATRPARRGTLDDCAMRILATVVSRPTDGRAILDTGSKTFSSDTLGLEGYGLILEYPQLVLAKFSEEHGHVDCSASNARPRIGERVTIIPNHACAVTNLHDVVYGVRGDRVERVFEVAAGARCGAAARSGCPFSRCRPRPGSGDLPQMPVGIVEIAAIAAPEPVPRRIGHHRAGPHRLRHDRVDLLPRAHDMPDRHRPQRHPGRRDRRVLRPATRAGTGPGSGRRPARRTRPGRPRTPARSPRRSAGRARPGRRPATGRDRPPPASAP